MSTSTADLRGAVPGAQPGSMSTIQAYFASDSRRTIQSVLGLVWLLDGALQFQSFMYSKGFIHLLEGVTAGQPHWIAGSVNWGAQRLAANADVYNTLFALVQVSIGLGLLYRPTVKSALLLSFGWALIVWWFGEAFGMLFMATTGMGGAPMANPLIGAPGAVVLYVLIGGFAWPNGRPGGLLGIRGARLAWGALWLLMAFLWLTAPSSAPDGVTNAINAAPSGMSWLSSAQNWAANAAQGNGEVIALVLAAISAATGIAVAANWRARPFLVLAVLLNLAYWVFGQGFGGIFQGNATDPNAGPLFVLLACALYSLVPFDGRAPEPRMIPQPGGS